MNNDTFAHRRAFYLLKKYSSYTWAEEIFERTKKFAIALETILRKPPAEFEPVNDMDEALMGECWYACGLMEEGLALLRQGNKLYGYTKFFDGAGYASGVLFGDADRGAPKRYVWNDTNHPKYKALGFSDDYDVFSTGMFELLERASVVTRYSGAVCLVDDGDAWYHPELVNNLMWPRAALPEKRELAFDYPRWLPDVLDAVPSPIEDTPVIVTGEEVPITGIWQPEPLKPLDRKILELIGGSQTYCMNFLVQGREAPTMIPESASELWERTGNGPMYAKPTRGPVRWRLIWRDDRYGDNGIPDEERNYLRMADEVQSPEVMPEKLRGLPGEVVPRSGVWWTPAFKNEQVRLFKQGERFPEQRQSDYGDVIWYLDSER